jgi:hypothetical protein
MDSGEDHNRLVGLRERVFFGVGFGIREYAFWVLVCLLDAVVGSSAF